MGISPIGSVGSPQIYNVNSVNAKSLNRIQGIDDDLTRSRTDFSGLTEASEETNPLSKGQTRDFEGLAEMGMAMGLSKAAMMFG